MALRARPLYAGPLVLDAAARAASYGAATSEQLDPLEAATRRWLDALEDLLEYTEDRLAAVRRLADPERLHVVADFEGEFALGF